MENQITITCPHCGKTYTDDPIITDAVTGAGDASRFITCECGDRLTFWAITAQLREQKKPGLRFRNWVKTLFKGRG